MKIINHLFFILLIVLFFSCENLLINPPDSNQNLEDFEFAWSAINDYYPYLGFKNIDWNSIYTDYRSRAENAKGDEIYQVLHDLLFELRDGHVYYKNHGGGKVYPYIPPRHIKDRHAYSPFVVRKYFDKELLLSFSKTVEYGIIPGNIGYAYLAGFFEDYLINDFPDVLEYLKDTKGLVLDVRIHQGGESDNAFAVISRFITSPLNPPDWYLYDELLDIPLIEPQGPFTYLNPVVVLINGSTFSTGEQFVEIMKQLPQVTVIGDTTAGCSCGQYTGKGAPGDYLLPSGKLIHVGTTDLRRYDGLPWEWIGIEPDIRIFQTEEDIRNGIDRQLEYAIIILKEN
ncbi:MAG: hypothetical protein JXB26_13265 [Candidatus Aminicenantes bacterium]|nr:hypothetical protein [Candidatus Aminicenantes bacterium]